MKALKIFLLLSLWVQAVHASEKKCAPENFRLTVKNCNDAYRYGFNGKLKDNEWAGLGNHYDFKFRGYDSRTGRFNSIDPLNQKYPFNSPYNFAAGSPISFIDENGKGPTLVICDQGLANKAAVSMSNHNIVELASVLYTAVSTNTIVKDNKTGNVSKFPNVVNNGDAGRGLTQIMGENSNTNGEKNIGVVFDPLNLNDIESKKITPKEYTIKVISSALSSVDKKINDIDEKIEHNEHRWKIEEKIDKEQPGDPQGGMAGVKAIHYYQYKKQKEALSGQKAEYEGLKKDLSAKKNNLEKSE